MVNHVNINLKKIEKIEGPYHISELLGPAAERIKRRRAAYEAKLIKSNQNK